MEEKYGIELELITNKFKSKIKETINSIKGLGKLSKQNITLENDYSSVDEIVDKYRNLSKEMKEKVAIDMGLSNSKLADTTLQQLSDNINGIKESLKQLNLYPVLNKEEIARATAELNDATATVNMFEDSINKLNNKEISPKINNKSVSMFEKFKKNIQTGWDEAISKVKRFGLSLVGIQSIWRLVSRASSAYLSQDIELANKLQSAWVGLGAMLAPILEWISNIVIKAVSYLNVFLKALFGIDLLARATSKSIKAMGNSAKSTSKALAGFDEITNIGDTGGLANGIENPFSNFGDNQLNQSWVEKIEDFGKWINKNKEIVIGGIAGIATALSILKIAGFGSASSLLTLTKNALGFGLMAGGLVIAVYGIIEIFKQGGDETKGLTLLLGGLVVAALGVGTTFGLIPGLVALAVAGIITQVVYLVKNIKSIFEEIKRIFKEDLLGSFKQIATGIKQIFNGNWKDGLVNIFKGLVNSIISILNFLILSINNIVVPIRALIIAIGKVAGKNWTMDNIKIPYIPKLNVGTNYVPNDTLAMIHKGEAVIPKRFNSQEYFGSGNNKTNELLETLIDRVDAIEINPYTTIKDVGKASVRYINNESRIMGESVLNI